MQFANDVSSNLESNEARHPEADMKVGLVTPKVRTRPLDISSKNNEFWAHFGEDKQPGEQPETASNG
jgi:hypothetical protein